MSTSLSFDPSRPCQVGDDLLALWLPRGCGRDALAEGLVASVIVCEDPACRCTIARLQAGLNVDFLTGAVEARDGGENRFGRTGVGDAERAPGASG